MLHEMVIEFAGGAHGVRDYAALESACARPQSGYYADVIAEAAAIMESLIGNHPFIDGNKRIGFMAADVCLQMNGLLLQSDPLDAAETIIAWLETGTLRFDIIDHWLRVHVVESRQDVPVR